MWRGRQARGAAHAAVTDTTRRDIGVVEVVRFHLQETMPSACPHACGMTVGGACAAGWRCIIVTIGSSHRSSSCSCLVGAGGVEGADGWCLEEKVSRTRIHACTDEAAAARRGVRSRARSRGRQRSPDTRLTRRDCISSPELPNLLSEGYAARASGGSLRRPHRSPPLQHGDPYPYQTSLPD